MGLIHALEVGQIPDSLNQTLTLALKVINLTLSGKQKKHLPVWGTGCILSGGRIL